MMTFIVTLSPSMNVLAHEGHGLGEGILHNIYHVVMTAIAVAVFVKTLLWITKRH